MANLYDGGQSLWQIRKAADDAANEATRQANWVYPYVYDGDVIKQANTSKLTGLTYSIDSELQFVPKPGASYRVNCNLYFSGSAATAMASGITIGLSGSNASSTYSIIKGDNFSGNGNTLYFTGNPIVISSVTSNLMVSIQGIVNADSTAITYGSTAPVVGPYWKLNDMTTVATAAAVLMKGSSIVWNTTV